MQFASPHSLLSKMLSSRAALGTKQSARLSKSIQYIKENPLDETFTTVSSCSLRTIFFLMWQAASS